MKRLKDDSVRDDIRAFTYPYTREKVWITFRVGDVAVGSGKVEFNFSGDVYMFHGENIVFNISANRVAISKGPRDFTFHIGREFEIVLMTD
jgi:hypothetical protein